MADFSFLMPYVPQRPQLMLPYAALAQWSGACRLWQGQASLHDPHHDFTHAAACGFQVPAGIGVTLMPLRHPGQAALQAQSLAVNTGHPAIVGYGPGATSFQASLLGAPYRSQLGAAREYVTVVRTLLEQGWIDHAGEEFTCRFEVPAVPRPEVSIGLGVLRPGMARLAGELADAAITWLTPASYLKEVVVPAVRAGAEAAGRPTPRVIAMVPIALAGADRDPVDLALASNAGHLSLPHYVDMLRRAGVPTDPADPEAGAKALLSARAFLYGELSELVAGLAEFAEAGVDEVVLNVTGLYRRQGDRSALAEIENIMGAVTG